MSGPKSSSYDVEPRATREARERARAAAHRQRSELNSVHASIAALAKRYAGEDLGIDLTIPREPAASAPAASWERYRRNLQDLCRRRHGERIAAEARIGLRRELGSLVSGKVKGIRKVTIDESVAPAKPSADVQARKAAAPDPAELQKRIQRRLASLDPEADEAVRSKLDGLLKRAAAAASRDQADLLLQEAALCVQNANKACDARRVQVAEARKLLDQLEFLPGPEAERARGRLLEVESGARSLNAALRTEAAEAAKVGKSRYADGVLAQVLADMGYDVEESFSTLFVSGGTIHFSRPSWKNYAVHLRVSTEDASLNYNLVREAEEGSADSRQQVLRDREMEETWCGEWKEFEERLQASGVVCDNVRRVPAGKMPVLVRRQAAARKGRRRRAAEDAGHERERES